MSGQPESPFKSEILAGKVAFVTGGGSGIGLEIARQLGKHGAAVALIGRRVYVVQEAAAQLAAEGIKAFGIRGDVRSKEDCERAVAAAVDKWGRLDILVNCAAGNFLTTAEGLSPNGFRTVLEIDLVGTFTMSRTAFPHLKSSGDATIINISAVLQCPATWYQAHAAAAKAGIDSLTRSLALEWGEFGIRVNAVAPGPIDDTEGFAKLGGFFGADKAAAIIPLKKLGTKWDIAMACVYLSCSSGRFVNGDVLIVDGGSWLWSNPILPRQQIVNASRSLESAKGRATLISSSTRSRL